MSQRSRKKLVNHPCEQKQKRLKHLDGMIELHTFHQFRLKASFMRSHQVWPFTKSERMQTLSSLPHAGYQIGFRERSKLRAIADSPGFKCLCTLRFKVQHLQREWP